MMLARRQTTLETKRLLDHVYALIEGRYESSRNPDNALAYHARWHTEMVVKRCDILMRAWARACPECSEFSERNRCIAEVAVACHDLVQRWESVRHDDGKILRRRLSGENEQTSSQEAMRLLWLLDEEIERGEVVLIERAMHATVPGWDPENSTVLQPNLTPESHPIVRAVALADIGGAGMMPHQFIREGDALFVEENLDIARTLRACEKRSDLPAEKQEWYRERMLDWRRSQMAFARGRQKRFEQELGNLPGPAKEATRQIFGGFDRSIMYAQAVVLERERMSFWSAAVCMGYGIPPSESLCEGAD